MPRRNRVDPFGDLHAVESRGLLTGNRGCLVDESRRVVRHHRGSLWIVCVTEFRDWRHPLDQSGRWTPLFFLDDAVALAADHRPCALCRRDSYRAYRDAVTRSLGRDAPIRAVEINHRLNAERLRYGRGLDRARDRRLWTADIDALPDGAVIAIDGRPRLVLADRTFAFGFDSWSDPRPRASGMSVDVVTPPTSLDALRHGFQPQLHDSVADVA